MTVTRLKCEMSEEEYRLWPAYIEWLGEQK